MIITFCLGIKVKEGLIALADTRITSGSECITAQKMSVYNGKSHFFFVMTSGLRSLRDKSLIYFEEEFNQNVSKYDQLYKVVNVMAEQIRKVFHEDAEALKDAGLTFNMHMLIGGQMSKDAEHKLFFIYPQGNWVMVGKGTPYQIIGATPYGKPILDRTLQYQDDLSFALKVGCLAFDSTRISAADVDFPLDVVMYAKDSFDCVQHRYEKDDLRELSEWWQGRLRGSIDALPSNWIADIVQKIPRALLNGKVSQRKKNQ